MHFCFRYWEAIKKWDEALQLTPLDETLYEMKAQVQFYTYKSLQSITSSHSQYNVGYMNVITCYL